MDIPYLETGGLTYVADNDALIVFDENLKDDAWDCNPDRDITNKIEITVHGHTDTSTSL